MLRAGVAVLSVFNALQVLLALGILGWMLIGGGHAPGASILFRPDEVPQIESRALATIDGLAILGNACIAAFCVLTQACLWFGVRRGQRWAVPVVFGGLLFVQGAAFASDRYFDNRDLVANLVSSAVVFTGLALCAFGVRRFTSAAASSG